MSRLVLLMFSATVQPTYLSSSVKQASIWETRLRTSDFAAESCPLERCVRNAGTAMAARIPMIRITTSSSISVKPASPLRVVLDFRVIRGGLRRVRDRPGGGPDGPPPGRAIRAVGPRSYQLPPLQPPPAGSQERASGEPEACTIWNQRVPP